MQRIFAELGLSVIERGWLSSNQVVFAANGSAPSTVVDTGYGAHAAQTVALVDKALRGQPLHRIVNTHLHSDHCGGNAALARHSGAEIWVPEPSFEVAQRWDARALSFESTGQRCERFEVDAALSSGATLPLGSGDWRVIEAPGHDSEAVMLHEPRSGVLITADALWQERLAIIFSAIDDGPGFADARATLDVIESLQPKIVIPGHGSPFTDVAQALQRSRARLAEFEREPDRHVRYATRALTMFHMMEVRQIDRSALQGWLESTPIFARLYAARRVAQGEPISAFADETLERLIGDGLLTHARDGTIAIR